MDGVRVEYLWGAAVGAAASLWAGFGPVAQVLLVLMLADIVSGTVAAAVEGQLNSTVSAAGIARKVQTLLLVFVVGWAGVTLGDTLGYTIPSGQIIAGAYIAREMVSLLENARRSGVDVGPLAKFLAEPPKKDPEKTPS